MNRTPTAVRPDEWRELPQGEKRVLVGDLHHADRGMMQLGLEDGGAFNVDVDPPMFSDLDIMLNPFLMFGVRRAILATATSEGWTTTLEDAFVDVEGHGCTTRWGPDEGRTKPEFSGPPTIPGA